jgi:branched-chain amino acid transport system substrate-binding protein
VFSDECQKFVWPSQGSHDKVVLLGTIVPASPPYDVLTVPLQNGVQLAIEDYNRTTDLPGGNRIAWIACDDAGSPVKAIAAAKHLAETLKVPAVVGPIFSEQVIAVAEGVTVPAGTFLIAPTATNKAITTLADDDLVWRPISSDVYQANAVADRVLELAPKAARVAMLGKADAYGKGIISDVTKRLSKLLGAGFKAFEYPDPAGLTSDQLANEYAAVLAGAWGAKNMHPDTFVFAGTSEVAFFVPGIMNLWNSEGMLTPAPRIIVTHGALPTLEGIVESAASNADKQTLIANLEGVAPDVLDPDNFASFNVRYKLRFNDTDAITFSSLAYDAALVTMFAMSAIPQGGVVTGAGIAGNIGKLVGNGPKVSFGDVDGTDLLFIKKAHNALVSGGNVDLKGVSGELEFDLSTGEVRTNVIGWGLDPKDMMNPTVPVLTPHRVYVLDPPPAEIGTWMNLP